LGNTSAASDKRLLADLLNLPTARYRHSLKFEDGKFERVTLLRRNSLDQKTLDLVDAVLQRKK